MMRTKNGVNLERRSSAVFRGFGCQTPAILLNSLAFGRKTIQAISALAVLSLAACAPTDRGVCVASHERGPWVQVIYTGKMFIPITHPRATVCDQWEYPEGRAAQAKQAA